MSNREYRDFSFGFLNNAQDTTDVEDFEGTEVVNLDPDRLALGSLEYKDFTSEAPAPRDYLETTLNGRRFFLGNTELSTTFSTGDYTTSSTGLAFYSGYARTVAFEFKNVSGSGFLVGNVGIGNALSQGDLCIHQSSSTQITVEFADSSGGVVLNCPVPTGVSLTDGEWHRFVVTTAPSGSNYTLTAFVDSAITRRTATTVAADFTQKVMLIGGNPLDPTTCSLKNLLIGTGVANRPGFFDGTSRSLGLRDNWEAHTDSPEGSGLDNYAGSVYTATGTPTSVATTDKTVGPLRYEVTPNARDREVAGETSTFYNVKGGPGAITGSNLHTASKIPVGDKFVVAFDFAITRMGSTVGYYNEFLHLSDVAGTVDGGFDLIDKAGDFVIKLNGTESDPVDAITGQRLRVVLTSSPKNPDQWDNKVYVNGELIISDVTLGAMFTEKYIEYQAKFPTNFGSGAVTTGTDVSIYSSLVGNLTSKSLDPALWDGATDYFGDAMDVVYSVSLGDIANDDQQWGTSSFGSPTVYTPNTTYGVPVTDAPLVNRNESPTTPPEPETGYEESLSVSYTLLGGTAPESVGVKAGAAYNGVETFVKDYKITVSSETEAGSGTTDFVFAVAARAVNSSGPYRDRGRAIVTSSNTVDLDHNIVAKIPSGTVSGTTLEFRLTVQATKLLDGKYTYRLVAIRKGDMDPAIEAASLPSTPVSVELKNLDQTGARIGNDVPQLTLPPILPGHPDRVDRIDIYRKDPDTEDFVKVGDYTLGGSGKPWVDNNTILDLPKVELLESVNDEDFSEIDKAVGNPSGNYVKVFSKDSRVWVVPSDRQDLLLYSREGDWWGWDRNNSFSFNGNITDVSIMRDQTVVSGLQTLVVATTEGLYHITGNGTPDAPYARIPMFGGDGYTDLNIAANSMLHTNGKIMLLTKSSDGTYEKGTYGQKVYEYDLQQLTEVSGRIRDEVSILGTGDVTYANIIGGDKYVLKKADQTSGVVYHRDARGWLTYNNTESGWKWTSKHFPRAVMTRGNPASAKQLKLDYIGEITLTFYLEREQEGDVRTIDVSLSSPGQRTEWQNMMPSGMSRKWWMTLEGDANSKVFGFWFVA